MKHQLSDDPGVEEIEAVLAQMQKSMSPDFDLVSDFRATLKHAEPMVNVAEAVAEAMVKLSRTDRDRNDLPGRLIRGMRFTHRGIMHTMRLNHGPLEPIFPGHCHEEIWICNPFGDTCIVLEVPWWCDPGEPPGNPDDDPIEIP
jgi:hypothetical protein